MKTLSPQLMRTLALVVLLALAGGAASIWLSRHKNAAPPQVTTPPAAAVKPVTRHTTPPAPAPGRPATKPVVAPKPAQRGNLVDARLPKPLQWALSQHRIVVVSFYDPQSDVDSISVAEAHQGAVDAKAGFLLVSVLDNAVAGPLTALLPGGGLLPDPGVLVYRAPGRVVYRFDGFADRDTIAQAAADAKAGQVATDVSDPGLAAASTTATTPTP